MSKDLEDKWRDFSEDKMINEANTTGYDCFVAGYEAREKEIASLKERLDKIHEMYKTIELRRGKSVAPYLIKYAQEIESLKEQLSDEKKLHSFDIQNMGNELLELKEQLKRLDDLFNRYSSGDLARASYFTRVEEVQKQRGSDEEWTN